MSLILRVIEKSEVENIFEFELKLLAEQGLDEIESRLHVWNSRWRKESLEHYLSLGWSFLAHEEDKILGYFLAQPLLFFDGQTQSLWVEHIQFQSLHVRDELCQLAHKLGREKHLQRVYFPNQNSVANAVAPMKAEVWAPSTLWTRTTKT